MMTPRGHRSLMLLVGQSLQLTNAMPTKTAITNLLKFSESSHSQFYLGFEVLERSLLTLAFGLRILQFLPRFEAEEAVDWRQMRYEDTLL